MQMGKLVAKSSELGFQNSSLRRKLAVLEDLYAALAKRSHACQKSIQTLVDLSDLPSSTPDARELRKSNAAAAKFERECKEFRIAHGSLYSAQRPLLSQTTDVKDMNKICTFFGLCADCEQCAADIRESN